MMWAQNFRILNVLRHQAEDQEKEQADAEQARIQQQSQGARQTDPARQKTLEGNRGQCTDQWSCWPYAQHPESSSTLYKDEDDNPYSQE